MGDTVSTNGVLSEEANEEIANYFKGKESIISPEGKLLFSFNTYLTDYVIHNLAKPPRRYTKETKKEDMLLSKI